MERTRVRHALPNRTVLAVHSASPLLTGGLPFDSWAGPGNSPPKRAASWDAGRCRPCRCCSSRSSATRTHWPSRSGRRVLSRTMPSDETGTERSPSGTHLNPGTAPAEPPPSARPVLPPDRRSRRPWQRRDGSVASSLGAWRNGVLELTPRIQRVPLRSPLEPHRACHPAVRHRHRSRRTEPACSPSNGSRQGCMHGCRCRPRWLMTHRG